MSKDPNREQRQGAEGAMPIADIVAAYPDVVLDFPGGLQVPLSTYAAMEATKCKAPPENRSPRADMLFLLGKIGADKLLPEHRDLLRQTPKGE